MSVASETETSRKDRLVPVLLEHMIRLILLVTLVVGGLLVPQLFRNVRSFGFGAVIRRCLGLLVLAESICLLSGHFDLSIGAIAGFSAVFTGMLVGGCSSCWGLVGDPFLAMGIILLVGGFIGFLNGVMIAKLNVNPFLQTLAFLIIFGREDGAYDPAGARLARGVPAARRNSTYAIGLLIAVFLLFAFIMRYTSFGQSVYAVGSSEKSARAVGVNTDRVIIMVYVISGVLAGLAGLMLTGYSTIVPPDLAENMVFPARRRRDRWREPLRWPRPHLRGPRWSVAAGRRPERAPAQRHPGRTDRDGRRDRPADRHPTVQLQGRHPRSHTLG